MKANPLPPIAELRRMFAVRSDGTLIRKTKVGGGRKPGDPVGNRLRGGYLGVRIRGASYLAHRIIWAICNGSDPGNFDVDHIDRDKTNNRPANLRLATRSQNCANKPTIGIHRRKSSGKFQAYVYKDRICIHLGMFDTAEEARAAHAAAKIQLFGEYAHV
jgi:hypothetical protein